MRLPYSSLLLACCLGVALVAISVSAGYGDKVLLKDVSAITLSANAMTTGRRSSPVPQMRCVGGPCRYAPTTALCSNAGFDGHDVLWKCKADLEKGIKLGDISVNCEGYDYPDDPYILKNSCGLEYTLTGQAEIEKQQHYHTGNNQYRYQSHTTSSYDSSSSGGSSWFMWIVIAGIVYILYKSCTSGRAGGEGGNGGGGGGGGGGAPGGPRPSSWSGSSQASYSSPPPSSSSSSSSSGPGFFSGMAAGSALGYMFGRSNSRGYNSGYGGYNSYAAPPVQSSFSSGGWGSSSSAPSSLGTSSSSAFGGTRRR